MNFPSLLSDHEQRAFSEFLNQLAQEDNPSGTKTDGADGTGGGPETAGVDPSLTQQQQQQLQLQLQHHLHLRQLQQQHQQQQQAQNGVAGLNRVQLPSMMPPPSLPMDAQQLAFAQQQRDWIQQISSNPLLAPGGVINPHAMSQAMLQNPLLMAQANAISQAMVLAQQQQQLQLQLQQQQQTQQQQHFQQTQQHQQQRHQPDNNNPAHSMHHPLQQQALSFQQQSNNSMLPPFHAQSLTSSQQQQYPGQQQQHQDREPLSPTSESGAVSLAQMSSGKLGTKRKSNADSSHMNTNVDNTRGSSSSRSSSPFSLAPNGQHSPSETVATNGNVNQLQKQESDVENGATALPQRKTTRRKGSTAKSMSMDSSSFSSLVAKSSHRTSRDGFDPLQGNARRKTKGDSSTKNGSSPSQQQQQQQQNTTGDAHDMNMIKEKSEEAEFKKERSSPSRQQKDSTLSPTPSQTSLSAGQPRSKKPHHELLTEAEKKANHIASEQKRRQNIRVGFDSLVEIVPTLSDCHRSEAVILQKSVDYIQRLLGQKNELKSRVRELQTHLGDPLDDVDSGSDMDIEPSE